MRLLKKKPNAWVVVNCDECPSFGGEYETAEEVFEFYSEAYATFTGRVFMTVRAASREMKAYDERVKDGEAGYIVCGVYCKQYDV